MTCGKLAMRKRSTITLLLCTMHPSNHIRKKYLKMERGHRLKNSVVLYHKMKKVWQKKGKRFIMWIRAMMEFYGGVWRAQGTKICLFTSHQTLSQFWKWSKICWWNLWINWWPLLTYSWNEGYILHYDDDDNICYLWEKCQREETVCQREEGRVQVPRYFSEPPHLPICCWRSQKLTTTTHQNWNSMVHIILSQSRLCITASDDTCEHFVGTDQHLWPWSDGNYWIKEEAIQIITE